MGQRLGLFVLVGKEKANEKHIRCTSLSRGGSGGRYFSSERREQLSLSVHVVPYSVDGREGEVGDVMLSLPPHTTTRVHTACMCALLPFSC